MPPRYPYAQKKSNFVQLAHPVPYTPVHYAPASYVPAMSPASFNAQQGHSAYSNHDKYAIAHNVQGVSLLTKDTQELTLKVAGNKVNNKVSRNVPTEPPFVLLHHPSTSTTGNITRHVGTIMKMITQMTPVFAQMQGISTRPCARIQWMYLRRAPTRISSGNEWKEVNQVLKLKNIFTVNSIFELRQNNFSTLPRYTFVENATIYPTEPTTNDHALIDSGFTNTFIVVNIKVKKDTKYTPSPSHST